MNKTSYLFPKVSYRGQMTPENLIFNANLQEFAQRVSHIANFETGGKISPQEAFSQVESLWKQLECP